MDVKKLNSTEYQFARFAVSAYLDSAKRTGIRDKTTYKIMAGYIKPLELDKNPVF